ncbi:CHAP domain-containing protein [Nocardioides sp. HDW12B]|uniref:CHAP domain-containing protein n=1 Tax=Nocardioides sp. HDW12B TaxID=2714939 RepID=UPI00140D118F|nr:CHAP domain-containing protein [Nocardioides sp. HDW12B]QIK68081.1 CHAP domain-containing protein [Nocardioides sp. HDW12B]
MRPLRRSALPTVLALLMTLAVLALPAPAGATITRLCTGYTSCANAGMSSSGYAAASGQMYWRMYSGHNCTNYAAYRVIKNGYSSTRPWDGSGNATYWGTQMSSITDRTPAVGAIAWWRAGVYPAGSAGHVAYVEKVISPTEIVISQDSWGGDFSWARITSTSGWPSGFIHFNDRRMQSVSRPVVSGKPAVGSTLSATAGSWNPSSPAVLYQWLAGGEPVQTGSRNTLEVTRAMVGKRIQVKVTASKGGYADASSRSERTAPVPDTVLVNTVRPVIEGTAQVDQTLVASGGRWTPRADTRSFQWKADGEPLPGATGRSLALRSDLVGKALSVTITAERAGYRSATASSAPTAAVAPASLVVQQPPVLEGAPVLGETLRLTTVGTATPDATRDIQWMRDGAPVSGATTRQYETTRADLGSVLTARVTWSREGYRSVREEVAAPAPVRALTTLTPVVTEGTGRFVVDATVTARGVAVVPSVVQVVRGGVVLAEQAVGEDGTVRLVVRDQRPGQRTYRIIVPVTDVTTRVVVLQDVTIS